MKTVKILTSNQSRKNSTILSSASNHLPISFDENCTAEVPVDVAVKMKEEDESISILADVDTILKEGELQSAAFYKSIVETQKDTIAALQADKASLEARVAALESQKDKGESESQNESKDTQESTKTLDSF